MTKHTPGPWEIDGISIEGDWEVWPRGDETGTPICTANPMEPDTDRSIANGRLIAAAPDLLDSLIKVRALISEAAMTGFNCHEGNWAERLFASQSFTHDAVRKACGRS